MKIHRRLEFHLGGTSPGPFIELLQRHCKGGWSRDARQEDELRAVGMALHPQFCFTWASGAAWSPVSLWLVAPGGPKLSVANVLSRTADLSVADYNTTLENFHNLVAGPAADEAGVKVELSAGDVALKDLLPDSPAERLVRFSRTANKATGATHPNDFERWLDFLTEAHRSRHQLTPELLGRWLREDEGWPADVASELVGQYEFGEDLLRSYDRKAG